MSRLIARYRLFNSATKIVLTAATAFLLALLALRAAEALRIHGAKAGVDSDGDGLSDSDEINIYATNPNLADTDGDRMTDGAEILAGTNPNSAASVFRIVGPPQKLTNGWRVSWTSVPGKNYHLERVIVAGGLATNWMQIAEQIATNSTSSFDDANVPDAQRYYRVRVEGVLTVEPTEFTPAPGFFVSLGGGLIQLNPDGSLPPFDYRPSGQSSVGAGQGFFFRFPDGARVITNSGRHLLEFTSAFLGFGPRSAFQLRHPLGITNGPVRTLPVGEVDIASLLTAFGQDPALGLEVTLFGKFPLRIMAGTFTSEGLRGARVVMLDASLPLPQGNHAYANYTLELEPDGSVRIPFSGTFALSDGTDNSAQLAVPPARPLWLELRADGSIGVGGRAELKFNPGPEFSVDFQFDDPNYELSMSAKGLHVPQMSSLLSQLPPVPTVPDSEDLAVLDQATEQLRCYANFLSRLSGVAVADTPADTNAPVSAPTDFAIGPSTMLDAWGFAASCGVAMDASALSGVLRQQAQSASAARGLKSVLDQHLALLRIKAGFAGGGFAANGVIEEELNAALNESAAAINQRASAADGVNTLENMKAVMVCLLEIERLRQQLGLVPDSQLQSALETALTRFAGNFTAGLGVLPLQFTPAPGSPIALMTRPAALLTLTQAVEVLRISQQLGLDGSLSGIPFNETIGQAAMRLWELTEQDLSQAESAGDSSAFLNALGHALDLVRIVDSGLVPANPALAGLPTSASLPAMAQRLEAVLQMELDSSAAAPAAQVVVPGRRKIIGGQQAPQPIPYQAALTYRSSNPQNGMYTSQFCGGSIVGSRWILTAAHCLENMTAAEVAVLIGVKHLASVIPSNYYEADALIVHPFYNPNNSDYDVALIHLNRAIDFVNPDERGFLPQPVTLLTANEGARMLPAIGTIARVSGWGDTFNGGVTSPNLLYVDLPISPFGNWSSSRITTRMLAAGYVEPVAEPGDSCQGDSGGPLIANGAQVGIVSFGRDCAEIGYPGIYARVSRFEPWIREQAGLPGARKPEVVFKQIQRIADSLQTLNVSQARLFYPVHDRVEAALAQLAQPSSSDLTFFTSDDLVDRLQAGIALSLVRNKLQYDTPRWWENTVLPILVNRIRLRTAADKDWRQLERALGSLGGATLRLQSGADRKIYLDHYEQLLSGYRQAAAELAEEYLSHVIELSESSSPIKGGASLKEVTDMLLPGDIYIDRIAGSLRYNRETQFLEGIFSGQLRLPKFDLSLTIDNARLNSGGAFDLNAYGQLGLGAPNAQLGTLSVLQRRPLQISFRPPSDLRFDGSARLALQNGMALESFLRLDDPIYEFGVLAEGLRFDLSRRLPQHIPVIPAGLPFETAGAVNQMLFSMAGALSQSARDASPLPRRPGAPPEFVAIPPPQEVESLRAAAGLRRARTALNIPEGTEALDELLGAQLTALTGAMTQGLDPLETPEKTAERASALLELVGAAPPAAAAGPIRKNEIIIPEYQQAALKLRETVLAQLNEAANRTEIIRAIKTLQAATHYEELRARANDPGLGSIETLLPPFIEDARVNYYNRVGLNPANGSIANADLFRNYHPPNHEAILTRISLLAQTAQNVFGDENPFDIQLFKDTVSTIRIQQRLYWVELLRKTPVEHFERRLEIITELNRLVTDAFNGKFDYGEVMRRIDGTDGPLQPIEDAEALEPLYLEAFNKLAAENKTGLLKPFLRGLRLTRVTFQREYPPALVAKLNDEVRAELQRFSSPQPSPRKNGLAKAGAQSDELRQPDLALDYVLELSRWAELEEMTDLAQLRSGALQGLMSNVRTQAQEEGAWWKLAACNGLLVAVAENTNDPPSVTLRSTLSETLQESFPTLRAIIDNLAATANALPIPDFQLPGNVQIPRAFGRLFYNRSTGYLQGHFGGRLEFPDLENAHFEITDAMLDNQLGFSVAANTAGPLPIGGVRLAASVTASGGTNQPFDFHGIGTMTLTNGPDVAVDIAFNTGTRTLTFDTAITDLETWRLSDELVLFDAGFGFTLRAGDPFGELRARGTAGFFAKGNLPTNQPISQTNFHLFADNITAAIQFEPAQIRLAFSNGTLHLPTFFYPTNMAALCPGIPGPATGPTVALSPANPIQATVHLAPPPSLPTVNFSGELEFQHFGLAVPGVPGLAAAICSARLLFSDDALPYLTNVNATLQIPLPRSTNNVDLEDGVFTLTGYPSGRLELRQDLPLIDLSGFKVIVLGQGHAECPQGSGLTVFPSSGFQQLPAFQIDGGLRVEAPAAMLSGVTNDTAYGLACGGIFITNGQLPRLSVDALQFGGTFHLGGSDGILLSNALISLEGIENILNPSPQNPFIARIGGSMMVPNGPGFTLSNAMFRFFAPDRLPRFSVDGMGFDLTGFDLVQSLPASIDRAAFTFKDPQLELPYLLSPTNITLSMSAHVSIPPGEDKFIGGRIDNVKMTVTPNGLLEIQSIAGLLLEIGSVSIPPIEEIGGKLYIGGLENLNPSEMYFVGRAAGSYQGYKLKLMMAFNMAGPIGMCIDVNAGAAGIPLGQTTFLFTGAGGGVSFLNNGQDPCEFTTFVDPEGKPLSSVIGGFPLPAAMSWQNLKSTIERMQRTATAYAAGQSQSKPAPPRKDMPLLANGFDCPSGCPPPTVNLFCQPHPDATLHPNRVIMKFTSIDEPTLNHVFHITPENMNLLGADAAQVATNFARQVRQFVQTNIPPFDAAFPGNTNAILAAVSETLDAMESTFSSALYQVLSNVPPSAFYGTIRDLAYVGAPCPDITLKVFGTFSQAAVSSFLSATVGGQITSAGNAGVFGNINLLGVPVGKGKIFVAATDDRGLPNPSACGEIEVAFGPLELGLVRGEMSCRDCVTGILREFYKLAQCISEPVLRQLASNAAPRLAMLHLPPEQLLNQMTDVEKIGFMAEVYQLPPGVIAGLPQCFITQFRQVIDVFQPYMVLCGVVEPRIFGLPLGDRLIEVSAEVSKTNIAGLMSYSPSRMVMYAINAATTVVRSLFPFEDSATFGFNFEFPDPAQALMAGMDGKLSSSNAIVAYAAEQFDHMLQNSTYTSEFELKPLGGKGFDTQARVVLPNMTNHPARPGSGWIRPEHRGPDYISRADVILKALEGGRLANPFWSGTAGELAELFSNDPRLHGLDLRRDYFPHGGYLGGAKIEMPRALTETPPDYLPALLNPNSGMTPLDRLVNTLDYLQNYLLSFTNRGSLAFYVPAPNPPYFTNSSGQNLGSQEMLQAISSFDHTAITNAQIAALYPFELAFLKGYFNATMLGIPMATGIVEALPPSLVDGRTEAVLRLEVAATPEGWLSHLVKTNNLIFEMRSAPPRPIEAWANEAFLDFVELSLNPDGLSQNALETLIQQRVNEFAASFATNLPKVRLESDLQVVLPGPISNLVAFTSAARLHAYSPAYDPDFSPLDPGPIARVRREGGIAFQGNTLLKLGPITLAEVQNAEFSLVPRGDGVPAFSARINAPVVPVYYFLTFQNVQLDVANEPNAHISASGTVVPFGIGSFNIAPGSGLVLGGGFHVTSSSGSNVSVNIHIDPAELLFPVLSTTDKLLIHGATRHDPFTFSTTGPWTASLELTNKLNLLNLVELGSGGLLAPITLAGDGTNSASFTVGFGPGAGVTLFPADASLRRTLTLQAGVNGFASVGSNGRFLMQATLGGSGLSFGNISAPAGATLTASNEGVSLSWFINNGAAASLNISSNGTIGFSGNAELPPLNLGIFQLTGLDGGNLRGGYNNDGFAMNSGALLKLNADWLNYQALALSGLTLSNNGAIQVSVTNSPGNLLLSGYPFDLTHLTFSRASTNSGGLTTLGFAGTLKTNVFFPGFPSLTFTGVVSSAGQVTMWSSAATANFFGFPVQNLSNVLSIAAGQFTARMQTQFRLGNNTLLWPSLGSNWFTGTLGADGSCALQASSTSVGFNGFTLNNSLFTFAVASPGALPRVALEGNIALSGFPLLHVAGAFTPGGSASLAVANPNGVFPYSALDANLSLVLDNGGLNASGTLHLNPLPAVSLSGFITNDGNYRLSGAAAGSVDGFVLNSGTVTLERIGSTTSARLAGASVAVPGFGNRIFAGSFTNDGTFLITHTAVGATFPGTLPVPGMSGLVNFRFSHLGLTLNGDLQTSSGVLFTVLPSGSLQGRLRVNANGSHELAATLTIAPLTNGLFRITRNGGGDFTVTLDNAGLHLGGGALLSYSNYFAAPVPLPEIDIAADGSFSLMVGEPVPESINFKGFSLGGVVFALQRDSARTLRVSSFTGTLDVNKLGRVAGVSGTLNNNGTFNLTGSFGGAAGLTSVTPALPVTTLGANATLSFDQNALTIVGTLTGGVLTTLPATASGILTVTPTSVSLGGGVSIAPVQLGAFRLEPADGSPNIAASWNNNTLRLPTNLRLRFDTAILTTNTAELSVASDGSFIFSRAGIDLTLGGFSIDDGGFSFSRSPAGASAAISTGSLNVPGLDSGLTVGVNGSLSNDGGYSFWSLVNATATPTFGGAVTPLVRLNAGASVGLTNGTCTVNGTFDLTQGVLALVSEVGAVNGGFRVTANPVVVTVFGSVTHAPLDFSAIDIRPVGGGNFVSTLDNAGLQIPAGAQLYFNNVVLGTFLLPSITIPANGSFSRNVGPVGVGLDGFNLTANVTVARNAGGTTAISVNGGTSLGIPGVNTSVNVTGTITNNGTYLIANNAAGTFSLPGLPVTTMANTAVSFGRTAGVTTLRLTGNVSGGVLTGIGNNDLRLTDANVGVTVAPGGALTLNANVGVRYFSAGVFTVEGNGNLADINGNLNNSYLTLTGARLRSSTAGLLSGTVALPTINIPLSGEFDLPVSLPTPGTLLGIKGFNFNNVTFNLRRFAPASGSRDLRVQNFDANLAINNFSQRFDDGVIFSTGDPAFDWTGNLSLAGFAAGDGQLSLRSGGLTARGKFNLTALNNTFNAGLEFNGSVQPGGTFSLTANGSLNIGNLEMPATTLTLAVGGIGASPTLKFGDGSGKLDFTPSNFSLTSASGVSFSQDIPLVNASLSIFGSPSLANANFTARLSSSGTGGNVTVLGSVQVGPDNWSLGGGFGVDSSLEFEHTFNAPGPICVRFDLAPFRAKVCGMNWP